MACLVRTLVMLTITMSAMSPLSLIAAHQHRCNQYWPGSLRDAALKGLALPLYEKEASPSMENGQPMEHGQQRMENGPRIVESFTLKDTQMKDQFQFEDNLGPSKDGMKQFQDVNPVQIKADRGTNEAGDVEMKPDELPIGSHDKKLNRRVKRSQNETKRWTDNVQDKVKECQDKVIECQDKFKHEITKSLNETQDEMKKCQAEFQNKLKEYEDTFQDKIKECQDKFHNKIKECQGGFQDKVKKFRDKFQINYQEKINECQIRNHNEMKKYQDIVQEKVEEYKNKMKEYLNGHEIKTNCRVKRSGDLLKQYHSRFQDKIKECSERFQNKLMNPQRNAQHKMKEYQEKFQKRINACQKLLVFEIEERRDKFQNKFHNKIDKHHSKFLDKIEERENEFQNKFFDKVNECQNRTLDKLKKCQDKLLIDIKQIQEKSDDKINQFQDKMKKEGLAMESPKIKRYQQNQIKKCLNKMTKYQNQSQDQMKACQDEFLDNLKQIQDKFQDELKRINKLQDKMKTHRDNVQDKFQKEFQDVIKECQGEFENKVKKCQGQFQEKAQKLPNEYTDKLKNLPDKLQDRLKRWEDKFLNKIKKLEQLDKDRQEREKRSLPMAYGRIKSLLKANHKLRGHGHLKVLHRVKKSVQKPKEWWEKKLERNEHFKQLWANLSDEAKNKTVARYIEIQKKAIEDRKKWMEDMRVNDDWTREQSEEQGQIISEKKSHQRRAEPPMREIKSKRAKRSLFEEHGQIISEKKSHQGRAEPPMREIKSKRAKRSLFVSIGSYRRIKSLLRSKKSLKMGSAHEKSLVIGRRGKTLLRVRRASIDNAVKQRARKKLFNVSDVFYPLPTTGKPPRDRRTEWTEERRKEQSRRLKQRWANRSEESKQKVLARLKKAQNKSLENRRKLKAEIDDLVRRMDGSNETWSEIIDSINRTAIKEGNNPTRPPEKQLPETNEEYQN